MLFINKKNIYITITSCMICLAILISYKEKLNNKQKTLQTVSLPVSGKTIVLDAGHGNPDGGAQSSNGVTEQAINLKITKKIQSLLEQSGCKVILTRSDENGIYSLEAKTIREKKVSDIKNRVKIGNESSADAFISVHLNKIPQSKYNRLANIF